MFAVAAPKALKGTVVSEQRPKGMSWSFAQTADSSDPLRDTFHQLQQAEQLRLQGKFDQAQAICEPLVRQYPEYFGALQTLGLIYADKGQYPQALGCLVRAVMLSPRSWNALTALSGVYLQLGATEMAAQTLEQASLIKPQDPTILVTLGEIYREEREYELARDAYRKAFEVDPTLQAAAIGLVSSYVDLGQYAEAAEILDRLIRSGNRSLAVVAALNRLPSSFVTVDVLSELKKIVRDKNEDAAEFENSVAFIRATALDKIGRHAEAWQLLVTANRAIHLARAEDLRDQSETQRANLAQLREKHVKALGDRRSGGARTISLFILGPSRSGKTTMEALTATLDGVKRGYENPSVEKAVRETFHSAGLLTSRLFEVLSPELDSHCRRIYLEELARRAGAAKVFTNTHPVRIHDAARVAAAFPNVRFIFVKRNLEDNLIRIYMRKYNRGNDYAYDLESARAHIIWYHHMIDLLVGKLPDITRVIHYEDMVADPAAAVRVAAKLCDLPMTDKPLPPAGDDRGCAAPYRNFIAAALGE
jgi:tetratricopeptide (TPR) repeat protein